jgi:uncharacterized hydrophobic protein (TIGR00271 family)
MWTLGAILVGRREHRRTLDELEETLFLDRSDALYKWQRFGLLLCLSALIASGGIVVDSTATVIGAMIVAPLGVPIMGVALATVVGSLTRLTRAIAGVVIGALGAALIGAVMSIFIPANLDLLTNPQIAGRVSPGLVDLVVAMAVGFVAAVGMMRKDLSDVLPGVAIAISLVPPMCVVGITAAKGAWSESMGALLLFVTNVLAMVTAGILLFGLARYRGQASAVDLNSRRVVTVVAVSLAILLVPLTTESLRYVRETNTQQAATTQAQRWVAGTAWALDEVSVDGATVSVRIIGTGTQPDPNRLLSALGPGITLNVDVQEGDLVTVGPS